MMRPEKPIIIMDVQYVLQVVKYKLQQTIQTMQSFEKDLQNVAY